MGDIADGPEIAWILTWNPSKWSWDSSDDGFEATAAKVVRGAPVERRWSVGSTKSVRPGDAVYLVRVGQQPRGLLAAGVVLEGSYPDLHWDPPRAVRGETVQNVRFRFTRIVGDRNSVLIPLETLRTECPRTNWTPQRSGTRVNVDDLPQLTNLVGEHEVPSPDELSTLGPFLEGKAKTIQVNAYERNPRAREACIKHHGLRCKACWVSLEEKYGEAAKDLIHIHHLTPLSSLTDVREVDPVRDLIPVCPNCHAVMHRREPPYTVEDLQGFLQEESD